MTSTEHDQQMERLSTLFDKLLARLAVANDVELLQIARDAKVLTDVMLEQLQARDPQLPPL